MTGQPLHRAVLGDGASTIVFLHAFAGSGKAWEEVAATLASRHRCVALDLRGFGQSQDLPEVEALADHVDDVIQALAPYEGDGYVLAGHSMGGKIALAVAAARPAGLKGVLLAASSPPSPEPMSDADRRETLASFGDRNAAAKRLQRIAKRPLGDDARARFVASTLATSHAAWRWWLRDGSREDITSDVRTIDLPVRIVVGANDPVIGGEVSRTRISAVLAGSELIEIAGAGHLLPLEAADELAALAAAFAASLQV